MRSCGSSWGGCPGLAARAEAEQPASRSSSPPLAARPSHGIRNLLDGPAPVSIIGDVRPVAITGYLARLYPRQMGRVRLIIGRLGADPALLEPTPIPIVQAAQLLGVHGGGVRLGGQYPLDGHPRRPPGWCPRHRLRPHRRRQGPAHRRRR